MFLHDDLHRVNAVRAALALVVSTVSVVAFSLFGPVEWHPVAVVAPPAWRVASSAPAWPGSCRLTCCAASS
ncbi:hypothetical protein [Nonomuraea sp. NPDC049607]|uniref:hypothetical protein n=1 Tax=Nonomuraea sp. NPDC049607 TaxID=3154732 RepID=UPI003416E718